MDDVRQAERVLVREPNAKKPNPSPFVKVRDLNNLNERDREDCNPGKSAVEIGLIWSF